MPSNILFINAQLNDYENNNLIPSSELHNSKCTGVPAGNELNLLINYV
jgi:hypothetical protein